MLKMFSTQLTGLFKRIMDNEEFQIEDGARLLAQAPVGEGNLYLKGFNEMNSVVFEAIEGAEPLKNAMRLESTAALTAADRVLIFSRYSDDEEALLLAHELIELGVPFVAVSGKKSVEAPCLAELAMVHIHTHLLKPLLPGEDGERVGFPASMAGLYIYFALKFTIEEILQEYE